MSKRYIDADKIEYRKTKRIYDGYDSEGSEYYRHEPIAYKSDIDEIPTADVEEVRHGEWVVDAYKGDEIVRIPYKVHEHDEPYCSLCGTYALLDEKEDYVPSNFCPRCGAKMDGERKDNAN